MDAPIEIRDAPTWVSPLGRRGRAFQVPLSSAPDDVWLSYLWLSGHRLELHDDQLLVWPLYPTDAERIREGAARAIKRANDLYFANSPHTEGS